MHLTIINYYYILKNNSEKYTSKHKMPEIAKVTAADNGQITGNNNNKYSLH